MNQEIKLGKKLINQGSLPYVIAEIGVNHEGSLAKAKELIELAKQGGADAAKFQTYKAEKLASKNSPSYWDTTKEGATNQFNLFKKFDNFGPDEYVELSEYCNQVGIDFVSTPFDDEAIEFLEPLVPFYKVASADLTNTPFLRRIAGKGKPIVLSTGATTIGEIDRSIETLQTAGCFKISLLHCILNYPTADSDANLGMISSLKRCYPDNVVGYSDHTLPDNEMSALVTSYVLGARVIEKHFTDDKTRIGNDHYHSMDCDDLARFVHICSKVKLMIGTNCNKRPIESESLARKNAFRSIVLKKSIREGHIISDDDITYKRPGSGISPLFWDDVLGRAVRQDLVEDHILQWGDLT
jgi:sialic acid synthase SpsE